MKAPYGLPAEPGCTSACAACQQTLLHSDYTVTKLSFNPFKYSKMNKYIIIILLVSKKRQKLLCLKERYSNISRTTTSGYRCNALNIHTDLYFFPPVPIFHLRMSISFTCDDLFLMSNLQHHNPKVDFTCKHNSSVSKFSVSFFKTNLMEKTVQKSGLISCLKSEHQPWLLVHIWLSRK